MASSRKLLNHLRCRRKLGKQQPGLLENTNNNNNNKCDNADLKLKLVCICWEEHVIHGLLCNSFWVFFWVFFEREIHYPKGNWNYIGASG